MNVRLTHLDGKLPNIALMKLSQHYKAKGDQVWFTRSEYRELFEPTFGRVYGSTIFTKTKDKIDAFKREFPEAIIGGTGSGSTQTIEDVVGQVGGLDYSIYPEFKQSIGFSQRGCRLKCKFCVVPSKEGRNRDEGSIKSIWRGDGHPKEIVLLDNDFFGQPDWKDKASEIIDEGYKVNFNQGINVRLIKPEGAQWLSKMRYYDVQFKRRSIYTAFDNPRDERIFTRGMSTLTDAGIPPHRVVVYMLVGYWPGETLADVMDRFKKIINLGAFAYPMVYNDRDKELKKFQRWVVRRYYKFVPYEQYDNTM
jgi:hypothetical protein